jgi:biopolymer transport protein ExbD
MALDVQAHGAEDEADLNTAINTTPLVDVMLVLLVIFLVTIPVVVQNIPLELPNQRNIVTETKPENIVIAVDRNEQVYFNNAPVDSSQVFDLLAERQRAITDGNYPEVHVRADKSARFETVGRVIAACQRAGVVKVGFITLPAAMN